MEVEKKKVAGSALRAGSAAALSSYQKSIDTKKTMVGYGLDKKLFEYAKKKLETQRRYLEVNTFQTRNGSIKTLLEISYSANLSPRYYAQLANRINTLEKTQDYVDNVPVFMTITLDGFFRDFVRGDFERFYRRKDWQDYLRYIPESDKFARLRTKIENREFFTVRDCYMVLRFQWFNFLGSYVFKRIRKAGAQYAYVLSVEPHEDGIPHFHALFFVPERFVQHLKMEFEAAFPAPRNRAPLRDKNKRPCPLGQTMGFQWVVRNPSGYVMKYIQKTFRNIVENEELRPMHAWYIVHKVRRVTTSRTVVPAWVYQRLVLVDFDWYYWTDAVNHGYGEWSIDDDYIFIQTDTGRWVEYDCGVYRVGVGDVLIKTFGERKPDTRRIKEIADMFKYVHGSDRKERQFDETDSSQRPFIPAEIDGEPAIYNRYSGKITKLKDIKRPVARLSDFDLLYEFQNFDFDRNDPKRFGLICWELFHRDMIIEPPAPLDDYNVDFDVGVVV